MGLSPQTLLEYGWRKQRFSVSVRINIKDNLAGITYEVKPFVTDSGSAVNIRNISFAATIGDFGIFPLYRLLDICGILPFVILQAITAGYIPLADKGFASSPLLLISTWQMLESSLILSARHKPVCCNRSHESICDKNIPSAVYEFDAAMCCACHIETVFFFATVKSDITC